MRPFAIRFGVNEDERGRLLSCRFKAHDMAEHAASELRTAHTFARVVNVIEERRQPTD